MKRPPTKGKGLDGVVLKAIATAFGVPDPVVRRAVMLAGRAPVTGTSKPSRWSNSFGALPPV